MKELSIRQPWAWFILTPQAHGPRQKTIENRDWPDAYANAQLKLCPPGSNFLLHASAGMTVKEFDDAIAFAKSIGCTLLPRFDELKRGGIVGMARLVGAFHKSKSPWFTGPIGLKLADVYPLPFRPMRGALGFFDAGELR